MRHDTVVECLKSDREKRLKGIDYDDELRRLKDRQSRRMGLFGLPDVDREPLPHEVEYIPACPICVVKKSDLGCHCLNKAKSSSIAIASEALPVALANAKRLARVVEILSEPFTEDDPVFGMKVNRMESIIRHALAEAKGGEDA